MIRSRTVNTIHDLYAQGKSIQDIAIELGIARNTVRKYLRHPELCAMPRPRPNRRGGYVASVDGIRFVVPIRSANTGPSPHYFGQGRGVTYLNYTSDQFTGLGGLVIPGTIRDSVYVLEALLEQESGLTPIEIMSDTASYSVM